MKFSIVITHSIWFSSLSLSLSLVQSQIDKTCTYKDDGTCQVDHDHNNECSLYLSPSTIPGAGLGMFVTREYFRGDTIFVGDLAIPLVDVSWHTGTNKYFSHFANYQWEGGAMGMAQDTDEDAVDIEAFCPGLDCAVNCNLALINVGKATPIWDDAGLHRYTSPGFGAITPYHNGSTKVINYIPKGGEIFKFYGDWWFQSRPQEFGLIPLREHHAAAEELCKQFVNMELNETIATDLWNIVDSVPWESRTSNALPHTYAKATQAAKDGIRSLYQPAGQKPLEDIRSQGRCMDNIRHDHSTLPNAGRGAFATRNLYKGQVITGSPLLHIPNREFLTMYEIEPNPNNPQGLWIRNLYKKIGHQLMMNYCFGYWETTIMLCPYASGVSYINHNQTMANVKIQWAKDGEISHNATYLEMDPVKLMHDHTIRLAFDYIATKDIAEGEELFLDYGDEWEAAWKEHVAKWVPKPSDKHYAPADAWNKKLANAIIRTEEEQELDPYPSNILIRGHSLLRRRNYLEEFIDLDEQWPLTETGYPCYINDRYVNDKNQIVYDVEIVVNDDENHDSYTLERFGIPRNALAFVNAQYSTDIHQRGVFRHEIGIPLEMLSKAWLNR